METFEIAKQKIVNPMYRVYISRRETVEFSHVHEFGHVPFVGGDRRIGNSICSPAMTNSYSAVPVNAWKAVTEISYYTSFYP